MSSSEQISRANQLRRQGDTAQAEAILNGLTKENPKDFRALHLLGIVRAEQGRHAESIPLFRKVIKLDPSSAGAYHNLANALSATGKYVSAINSYDRSLKLNATNAHTYFGLGSAQHASGRHEEAVASYRRGIKIDPNVAGAHHELGSVFYALQRFDEAIDAYRRVLELNPNAATTLYSLGTVYSALGDYEAAIDHYTQAIMKDPTFVLAYRNLGMEYAALNRFGEAVVVFQKCVEFEPDNPLFLFNLGLAQGSLGHKVESAACYRRVIELDPDYTKAQFNLTQDLFEACAWEDAAAQVGVLADIVKRMNLPVQPHVLLAATDDPELHQRAAVARVRYDMRQSAFGVPAKASPTDERIRVAYVSCDFRRHPVTYAISELIELHDRDRFEIVGISYGPDEEGAPRERLRAAFDSFHDVRAMDDRAVAQLIADNGIHIAVDLNGYTTNSRSNIFAHRAAPIQVNYLGFLGTMGADFIDYIIADDFVIPADQERYYTESVVRLPDCHMPTDRQWAVSAGTPARSDENLPETGFVFCCFNQTYKIRPKFFDVWMRLLGAVPGSVLWMGRANDAARARLCEEAAARGIEPERLVFAGSKDERADHLARLRLGDLFLDTLPYNAHATTSDALWVGLPVVTSAGKSFVGRCAASQLHAIGMPELVTDSLEAYEALALELATDPDRLSQVRERLAANRDTTALFDSTRYCRHVEAAYGQMFETWRGGLERESFRVDPVAR